MKPCKPHPELDALMALAKNHVMTREEMVAQRKSWVIGEMLEERPDMTREEAERIYDEVTY
ncbi:MAG: hypothetical protein UY74_C0026G0012 [Candidatus Kaiserbacteria bacterium GW2011_GWC2_52_8b]|uniref:Uncharacterized protein n=2 Tax=Candidatus Kaiseribacteriota TaxID=1752734 RepID=A0A0G1XJB8_9BACT|nr:MAG: hypothetical protein UY67_C0005G0012 [Candidatus Kaiserbacteria bacterium GW2011_GWA2_52_12]KKW31000.1 MAG: hypothetical protein UY74_C0026G0012 [Candidatus Kaiserbacteria bacterium GW2011_GWC2_52_8b]